MNVYDDKNDIFFIYILPKSTVNTNFTYDVLCQATKPLAAPSSTVSFRSCAGGPPMSVHDGNL